MADMMGSGTLRSRMQEIDPYEFQSFVADLWEEEGWEPHIPQNGESSVVAERSGAIDQQLLLQTRRYSAGNTVGKSDIQQAPDADTTVVVTTSEFTDQAKAHAYDHDMKLVDGDDLADMVREHGREDLIDEYAPEASSTEQEASTAEATESWLAAIGEGRLASVAIVTLAQIGALVLTASTTQVPIIPTVGLGVFVLTWFAAPVVIYKDLKAIGWGGGSQGGAIIFALVAFVLPIIVPCWYLYRRITG